MVSILLTFMKAAALAGDLRIVQLLMEHGAHVDAVTDEDWTPLHLACQGKYTTAETNC